MNCEYCEREVFSKGMCKRHYQQERKYGHILSKEEERERLNKRTECSVENCNSNNFAKGYCQKHYMQLYRTKDKKPKEKIKIIEKKIEYVILDLERSLLAGGRIYWKSNRRGYTPNPAHAGIYSKKQAVEIALNDREGLTALLPLDEDFNSLIKNTQRRINYEDQ